jgi:hypothetical protein
MRITLKKYGSRRRKAHKPHKRTYRVNRLRRLRSFKLRRRKVSGKRGMRKTLKTAKAFKRLRGGSPLKFTAIPAESYNTTGNGQNDALTYQKNLDLIQQQNNSTLTGGDGSRRIIVPQFATNALDGPTNANTGSVQANTTNITAQNNAVNDHFATDPI